MPSHEWHAARAREKLQAHQNALPPEERMINRTDWDDEIIHRVAVTTARAQVDAKRRFVTLAVDPNVGICETRDQALAYFSSGGPPLTTAVLRKFAEGLAISSRPILRKEALSACSCTRILLSLWAASNAAGKPVPREIKEATLSYVYGPLVTKGLIHTEGRKKFIAVDDDLSNFLKMLFSPRFAITLTSTRELLLLALFICLQVDCTSRATELLMPSMNSEDTEAWIKTHSKKMFRWQSVALYAFPNQGPGGRVTLRARLTFSDLKDPTNMKKRLKVKMIPIRLLPPEMVATDSLFWLVTLGLIDGVFENIRTWDDIEQLNPGENGLFIPFKPIWRDIPVFRSTTYHPTVGDDLVSKKQTTHHQILDRLHLLSRFCGLNHAMLPNVLRRSSANMLALTVTPEERRARMGHVEGSKAFERSYRNSTSTVDFQALRLKIEPANVAKLSSVFLNTSPENPPPKTISDAGMTEILNKPDLIAMSTEQSELLDQLKLQHGSLDAAKTQDPARYFRYDTLQKKHCQKFQYLKTKKFDSEYKAWCNIRDEGPPEQTAPQSSTSASSEIDQLLEKSQYQDDNVPIDPQILEEAEAEETAAANSLTKACNAVVTDDQSDSMEIVQNAGHTKDNSFASSHKPRKFIKDDKDLPLYTLVDHLPTFLFNNTEQDMTWAEISGVCTTALNHLHSPGRFYPNQEPLPGTWDCRFCGMSFLGDELSKGTPPENHSYHCEAERLAKDVREALPSYESDADQACPLGNCSSKQWNTSVKFTAHVRTSNKHFWHGDEARYFCNNHEDPLLFQALEDLRIHAIIEHSAPKQILPKDASQALVYFCPFCQVLISRLHEYEEAHLQAHIDTGDALSIISEHGIAGYEKQGMLARPGFCIFCLYDTRECNLRRFKVFSHLQGLMVHLTTHVQGMTDAIPCPAAGVPSFDRLPRCAQTGNLDVAGMKKHLEEVHGYRNLKLKFQKKGLQRAQEHLEDAQEDVKNGTAKRRKAG